VPIDEIGVNGRGRVSVRTVGVEQATTTSRPSVVAHDVGRVVSSDPHQELSQGSFVDTAHEAAASASENTAAVSSAQPTTANRIHMPAHPIMTGGWPPPATRTS
jgi:hypothetical protein